MTAPAAERQTGAENVLWDLSVLYSSLSDPKIQADMDKVEALAAEFEQRYKGKVAALSAAELLEAVQTLETIYELSSYLSSYASLNFSTATNDAQWGAFLQKVSEHRSRFNQRLVFFDIEWNLIEDEQAAALLTDPLLATYRYHLESERRYKPYQLTELEEQLLMERNVTGSQSWVRFFTQLTSKMTYLLDGEKVTQSTVLAKLQQPDRDLRQRAADAITVGLQDKSMELTFIFNVLAADKASVDRLRKYPSWISSRNLSNKAPDAVVEALIETVTSSYGIVAQHYETKRRLLGYDALYDYDRYAPLNLKDDDSFYDWSAARQLVVEAYQSFSPTLGGIADRFFAENWIHAPVKEGKRGGAYASYGTKSTHPYVFLNYTGRTRDVMTLAHELGHGVHMYLAAEHQPFFGIATPLTTAETASVFGEMIVFQDLMRRQTDREVRLAMLASKIEDTFATVFRQISMNRFEDALHTARRTQGELTTEQINDLWMNTQTAMFGNSVTLRDQYRNWWSYVPHFLHTPGYVYAYAFGELLVLALYNLYQQRGSAFIPQYEGLLAAGDSDYPANLLAKVGVDLNDPQFWHEGIAAIQALVDEETALARALYPEKFA